MSRTGGLRSSRVMSNALGVRKFEGKCIEKLDPRTHEILGRSKIEKAVAPGNEKPAGGI